MFSDRDRLSRREFVGTLATAVGLPAMASGKDEKQKKQPLKLGLDNFAVRAFNWKDKQLIDYAASLKLDCLFITDLYAFASLEDGHLREVKKYADDRGIELYVGTWSICPTSTRFKKDWGTAEEHLALGIRVAKALGSPVIRVILGTGEDRRTPGGIDARIKDTIKVLHASRKLAKDNGVKVAVENHAGDMHSLELVRLIKEAGTDFVGANMDAGNAVRTLEHPLDNLENLGPYALTTSLRDTAVWKSANGVTMQWTAMGEGMVDWKQYFKRFAELCPEVPVNIETISGGNTELAIKDEEFWKAWPKGKPKGFERFLAWAEKGKPRPPRRRPRGVDPKVADQQYQRAELERSIAYCKSIGLGRKR
ncbi:MAG: hypothetical protein KatS3mg105_1692 [Gemmatales bacterium]|nr:MAG: hypothetical protein KatS3mg105_1692 [Gemmatales bacterium]